MPARAAVLGVDPGFAHFGYAVVALGVRPEHDEVVAMGVVVTEKVARKRNVLDADDNVRRTVEIAAGLARVLDRYPVRLVCAESISMPRNSGTAAKIGLAWGALCALVHARGLALVHASPQQLKLALCGTKSASKQDVEQAVRARYPGAAVAACSKGIAGGLREHAFDALGAAAVLCERSNEARLLRGQPI